MKLLFCISCGDIISPGRGNDMVRWCFCGEHAVWWHDTDRGILHVHDAYASRKRCFVLGINNDFLMHAEPITAHDVKRMDDECPDSYLFKRLHSPLVRFRPGETADTAYAELPTGIVTYRWRLVP